MCRSTSFVSTAARRAVLTVVALSFAAATSVAAPLRLDQYLDFERVSEPQISPDGGRIVYTRRWVDKVHDRWRSSIWIMSADGTRNRFLLDGSSPRWSPDGSRLAYVADGEPAGEQIFVRWMDAEGGTTQITRIDETPASIEWSPDGESIAFVQLVPAQETWKIDMPKAPEGAEWTKPPRIVERLTYRRDRQGFLEQGFHHVFVVPATGGTPRQLTDGDFHHGHDGLTWTHDGSEILFTALRTPDWEWEWRESEIWAVRVADRRLRQVTRRHGPDQTPVVSPDGRLVAYTGYNWTDDTYVDAQLYVIPLEGGEARVLTPELDRTPRGLLWAEDSSGVYFNISERGTRNLYFAPLRGKPRTVTQGQHMLETTDVGGDLAVGVLSSVRQPEDVVLVDLRSGRSGATTRLTRVNDDILADVELGEVEEIWYDSVDGLRIQGWIVKPPDFDAESKYPLMLSIHGGPHGMYGTGFNFAWQEHAAKGYVVLYTNPRGSSGYGSAFGNAIKNAYPGKDYDDLMRGVDEVIARGYVDPSRMFVYGCSGGGVLTSWVVGHTDRFAAASANCPVTNWLSFVGTTDGPGHWYRNFAKMFWEDPSEHLRRSPLMYVGNVSTPTMLMTGVNDLRTPISQTEEFYEALKMRKVPTAMVRFNDEFHGTSSKPSNFLRTQLYLRYWFERHSPQPPGGEAATGAP